MSKLTAEEKIYQYYRRHSFMTFEKERNDEVPKTEAITILGLSELLYVNRIIHGTVFLPKTDIPVTFRVMM